MNIELIENDYEDFFNKTTVAGRIKQVMEKIQSQNSSSEFGGKIDRCRLSSISFLIIVDGEDAGFIYGTRENRYTNGIFIDMALLKEYRGQCVGRYVLNKFINIPTREFMIGEVEENNKASNLISSLLGEKIISGDINYYLFPKKRLNEFNEYNKDNKFQEAMSKSALSSIELMHELMNQNCEKGKSYTKRKV